MKFTAQDFGLIEETEEVDPEESIKKEEVIEWFWEHQNPSDEEVHEWAESLNVDESVLEEVIYELVTDHVKHLKEDEETEEEPEIDLEGQWYD